jgi:DNA-binding NtrC family response regulator
MMVEEAADGEEGRLLFEKKLHPVVLLDLKMPRRDGLSLLEIIHAKRPETRVLVMSGHGTTRDVIRALNLRAAAYMEKPADLDTIIQSVWESWKEYCEQVGIPDALLANLPAESAHPDLADVRRVLSKVPVDALSRKPD